MSSENLRTGETSIAVTNLTKRYSRRGHEPVEAVDGISFEVSQGSIVGLLGPNGAGKTTTIKSILGLVEPTEGTVRINGVDASDNPSKVYRMVSAVLEGARNTYWRLTVEENLEFFASLQGFRPADVKSDHERYLRMLDLMNKRDAAVRDLSRGMQQKAALACALARKTDVLFLDEPTLGLDIETSLRLREELCRLADEEDRTIVLSSHDMDVVQEVCDRVIIMGGGEIVTDEQVEELIDLFQTQRYEISVSEELSEREKGRLEREFAVDEWTTSHDHLSFQITLEQGAELYDVMELLQSVSATPVRVNSMEPNLEEAFLNVLEDENETGQVPSHD